MLCSPEVPLVVPMNTDSVLMSSMLVSAGRSLQSKGAQQNKKREARTISQPSQELVRTPQEDKRTL